MNGLRTAHLFAGAGGGLLADLILGHRPVLAVEHAESCCQSLRARVSEGWLPASLHIHCGDVQQFDFSPWAGRVDCIAAGFPCQDISCAGSGKGLEGARSILVWEVFRAIDAIRPGIVFLENSPKILTKGHATLSGLSWRGDIPGVMERLPLLLSEQVTNGTAGGCSLPTLTACGNWHKKGASANSGDGLATAIKRLPTLCSVDSKRSGGEKVTRKTMSRLPGALKHLLPTLCASDYKSPYNEVGYHRRAQQRCLPLRDTLAHITGHRLTPEFAEYWMGWPLRWSAAPKERG